ncbi:MAG: hypothetical protein H0U44_01580 [Flavisolibacter sp.]|nr:hypothetical protein [Flavisolibacter sp.]
MRMINKTLKRNRDILMNSLTGKKRSKKISLKTLELKGYQFHYFTHQAPDKNGQILRFCYEFGYLTIDQQRVLLVKDPPL